jgi:hypothetical protein
MLRFLTVIICIVGWSVKRMLTRVHRFVKRIIQRKIYISQKVLSCEKRFFAKLTYISQNADANLRSRRENLSEPSHHIFMNLVWYFYLEFATIFTICSCSNVRVHVCTDKIIYV